MTLLHPSTLTAVVYVFVFFCATVVRRSSAYISKELETTENLQCKWSVKKGQQKSLQSGGLAEIQDLRVQFLTQASQSSLVVCFIKAWIDTWSQVKQMERKSVFVIVMILSSEAACKDEVINLSNTDTRTDGSRKSNSKVVRTRNCLFFCV